LKAFTKIGMADGRAARWLTEFFLLDGSQIGGNSMNTRPIRIKCRGNLSPSKRKRLSTEVSDDAVVEPRSRAMYDDVHEVTQILSEAFS